MALSLLIDHEIEKVDVNKAGDFEVMIDKDKRNFLFKLISPREDKHLITIPKDKLGEVMNSCNRVYDYNTCASYNHNILSRYYSAYEVVKDLDNQIIVKKL